MSNEKHGKQRRSGASAMLGLAAAAICLMPPTGNSGPADRVEDARQRREAGLRETFQKCGVRWPAAEVFLRAMKREGEIELWAGNGAGEGLRLVKTFPVLAQSGGPGPKRREGDMQVPEGFYEVNRFNPRSNFHLSLGVNYPNASDRVLADPSAPGFDIFIHGGKVSVGCLALGDPAIEELYLAAAASRGRPIHVHFFPARMSAPDWPVWRDAQLQKRPELRSLWAQLAVGWDHFERKRRVPRIEVGADGTYRCAAK